MTASPWANGIIERVNRILKSTLSKLIEDPSDWINQLNKVVITVRNVQYVINNIFH